MTSGPWFHGGVPGLEVGGRILPPDITGAATRLSGFAGEFGAPHGTRTDVVYLAANAEHARAFAALYPDGALYQVEPDPDAPEVASMTTSAIITAVVRPRVNFAHRRPESWLRLLVDTQKAKP